MQECDWIPHEIWDTWSKYCECREDKWREREGGRERGWGRERGEREHTCCLLSISHLLSTFRAYTLSLLFILATYSPRRHTVNTHAYIHGKLSTMELYWAIELLSKVFVNLWKLTLNRSMNCLPWLHQMLLFRWFQGSQNRWWSIAAFLLSLSHLWLFACECVRFIEGGRDDVMLNESESLSLPLTHSITVPKHLQVSKATTSTLHYSHYHLPESSKLFHVRMNYTTATSYHTVTIDWEHDMTCRTPEM